MKMSWSNKTFTNYLFILMIFLYQGVFASSPFDSDTISNEELKKKAQQVVQKKKSTPKNNSKKDYNPVPPKTSPEDNIVFDDKFYKQNSLAPEDKVDVHPIDPTKLPTYQMGTIKTEDAPPEGPLPKLEIIVDSSGSMGQLLNADRTKMFYLKKMLTRFFGDQWKEHEMTSLRVYGSKVRNDCDDNFLAVKSGEKSLAEIESQVAKFYPVGRTPLYKSIKDAIMDVKDYKGPKRVVIFTDGEDTCGGDPCKLTKETSLAETTDIKFFVVAIGFPPGKDSLKKVSCIGDTLRADNENDMFNGLGQISNSINKQRNLMVISPNPLAMVQLFKIVNGKPEFFRAFTAAWGVSVPPGEYEAVVMLEPNYKFPRFTIPPKKKVTLQVFGEGTVTVKFNNQLLDVEMLDKNSKVITKMTSDVPTKVPVGKYKMRIFRDPFYSKLVQPVFVYPNGEFEYDASEAGVVQINNPDLVGLYIYDSRDKLLGNYLTNFPVVLPRGDYRVHVNEKCSFDRISVIGLGKMQQYECTK